MIGKTEYDKSWDVIYINLPIWLNELPYFECQHENHQRDCSENASLVGGGV